MDFGQTIVAGLAITLGICAPITLIGLILWYKSRKTRLIHETALRLAEKGQPVPPELFMGADEPFSDLRRGVVLVALGAGLALFMVQSDGPWSLGLIPIFMGAGYLVVWKLETGKVTNRNPST
jgi:hypothetical protein